MSNKEMWIQNHSKKDVILSDLGIKICVGKTINVYKLNPNLSEETVAKSMKEGSLYRRIELHKVLKVVQGPVVSTPPDLNKITTAKSIVYPNKAKSSVLVDSKDTGVFDGEASGKLDAADWGFDDANLTRTNESVFASAPEQNTAQKTNEPTSTGVKLQKYKLGYTAKSILLAEGKEEPQVNKETVMLDPLAKIPAKNLQNTQPDPPKSEKAENWEMKPRKVENLKDKVTVMDSVLPQPEIKQEEIKSEQLIPEKTQSGTIMQLTESLTDKAQNVLDKIVRNQKNADRRKKKVREIRIPENVNEPEKKE